MNLTDHLAELAVGDPDVAGPLSVFPTFGPAPQLEYVSFAEGAARGVAVTELPGGASVNDLLVVNPLDVAVLLYEGEELRGAQQDRTVDGAVLVPAGIKLSVPVSCVERGRWDGTRHAEPFAPSPVAAFPSLRAAKSARMREALAAAAPARADQSEVWDIVGPDAMADGFAERSHDIDSLSAAMTRRDGQTGAIVAFGGRIRAFDHVSRPDVWAALHAPLVRGYALDALRGQLPLASPSADEARDWLAGVTTATTAHSPATGAGNRLRFAGPKAAGTGLVVDGELIQLSAYAEESVVV